METWNICIDHGRSILKTHPDGFNFPLSATAVTWCILKPRPFGSDISCPGGPNSELLASLVSRPFQLTTWIIVVWTLQLLFWLIDQLDTRSMTYQHYWHDVFYADTMQWCNSRIWNHQTFFTDLQWIFFQKPISANLCWLWLHPCPQNSRCPLCRAPYSCTQARHARWEGPVQREEPAVDIHSTMQKRPHFSEGWFLIRWLGDRCCVCFRSFMSLVFKLLAHGSGSLRLLIYEMFKV